MVLLEFFLFGKPLLLFLLGAKAQLFFLRHSLPLLFRLPSFLLFGLTLPLPKRSAIRSASCWLPPE